MSQTQAEPTPTPWPKCHHEDCLTHTSGRKDGLPTCFAHGGRKR